MAAFSAATFGVSYFGPTKFQNVLGDIWDISALEVYFENVNTRISVELSPSEELETAQYPSFKISDCVHQIDEIRDTLYISPETAKTMRFSAWIFQKIDDDVVYRDYVMVPQDELPAIEIGKCYWIQMMNMANRLKATFVEVHQRDLECTLRLMKLHPQSLIYAPVQEIFFGAEQEQIYQDFEGLVYSVDEWIRDFANQAGLPLPSSDLFYVNLAKKELRQLIELMPDEIFKGLLTLKKEGEACQDASLLSALTEEYQQAQAAAIGFEGYCELMRKLLEEFAGEKASLHREKIEAVSEEFAGQIFKFPTLFP